MTQKMLIIDHQFGVLVGPGRFENWLFRRHADGYWVSARKLPEGDPLENSPIANMIEDYRLTPSSSGGAQ
jgi:hypothetical protein